MTIAIIYLTGCLPLPTTLNACQNQSGDPTGVEPDSRLVAAAGIREISGRYVTLYTDIRDRNDLDDLVRVFDLAVPQWCAHFQINLSDADDWRVQAFLIADEAKFKQAKLIPADLPDFAAGHSAGSDLWFYLQPGDYYTRHLFLHEGTHAFMSRFLGTSGLPWYSEGMAEWLGVHQWDGQKLKLGFRLRDRNEADYWGRVKIVRDDLAADVGMPLEDIFQIPPLAYQNVRFYGWSWAACEFFTHHPLTRDNFSDIYRHIDESPRKFRGRVLHGLSKQEQKRLHVDWNLFIHEIDYGYDISAGALSAAKTAAKKSDQQRLSDDLSSYEIASNRSWQLTDLQVNKGDRLAIEGTGRFQVKLTHQPWTCEAGGVTLEYYAGRPLGMLVAGILPDDNPTKSIGKKLLQTMTIGCQETIEAQIDGTLCLRINESPADLKDNLGTLEVTVKKLK